MKLWQVPAQRAVITVMAVVVMLAMYPLAANKSMDVKTIVYEAGAFIALCVWLMTPRRQASWVRPHTAIAPLLVAFVVLNLAATALSLNAGYSFSREFVKLAALSIVFVASYDVFDTVEASWNLTVALCVAVTLTSIYGIAQYLGYDPYTWESGTQLLSGGPSTYGNPNFASHVLAPTLVLTCGICTQKGRRWMIVLMPVLATHLAIARTRGSLLGLACAITFVAVAILVSRYIKKPNRAILTTALAMLFVGVTGAASIAIYAKATTGQPVPFGDGESVRLRYHSFYGACEMIRDNPVLGYGPGMYAVGNPPYWTPFEQERFSEQFRANAHVHNEPLEIAVEAGIPAAAIYLSLLVLGTYYGLYLGFASTSPARRRLGLTLAAFHTTFAIDGLFGFNMHVPASAFVLFAFLGVTAAQWRQEFADTPRQAVPIRPVSIGCRAVVGCIAALFLSIGVRDYYGQVWHSRAKAMLNDESYSLAVDCFRKAESLMPHDWLHSFELARTYMKMSEPREAADSFQRTLQLNPNFAAALFESSEVHFNLALASTEESDSALSAALAHAERAAKLNSRFPAVHDTLGRAYLLRATRLTETGQGGTDDVIQALHQAESHLIAAIEHGSKRKDEVYRAIAAVRKELGDENGAMRALVSSIAEDPEDLATWEFYRDVSEVTGDYGSLMGSLDSQLERPFDPAGSERTVLGALLLMRAEILHQTYHDELLAEAAYKEVIATIPDQEAAWSSFYGFVRDTNNKALFIRQLNEATMTSGAERIVPPPSAQVVATALDSGLPRLREAVSRLMDLVEQESGPAAEESRMSKFAWAAKALSVRAAELQLTPEESADIHLGLGLVLASCGVFDRALTELDRAQPNLSGDELLIFYLRKAETLVTLGEDDDAISTIQEAVKSFPTNLDLHYSLARLYARSGRIAEARLEYRFILSRFNLDAPLRASITRELDSLTNAPTGDSF